MKENIESVWCYLYLPMPDFLVHSLSTVANAIFIGGEHLEEFWGAKRYKKQKQMV